MILALVDFLGLIPYQLNNYRYLQAARALTPKLKPVSNNSLTVA
jgi:hypothetical protein